MSKQQRASTSIYKKLLRISLRLILVLVFLFVGLILFIKSPWGQDLIVGKLTTYVSKKIDTPFSIGKLYVTFSGNLTLEEFYLEDQYRNTLVYSKYLEANIPFRPLLFGNEIKIDFVEWKGLKANVIRKDSIKGFNYQYIIDAFMSSDEPKTTSTEAEKNTENATKLSIGRIAFTDFDLKYLDEVIGIDSELILGSLELESKSIDLQNMKFHLSELNLNETSISFSKTKTSAPSEDDEETVLPWILVDEFNLEQVSVNYNSLPEDLFSEGYIERFSFSGLEANLENQNFVLDELVWEKSHLKFEMESFSSEVVVDDLQFSALNADINNQIVSLADFTWKDSSVKLEMQSTSTADAGTEKTVDSNEGFSWPQWKVNVTQIDFQNQNIEFFQNGKRPKKGKFSAEALSFEDFNFRLNDFELSKEEHLSFNLHQLQFREKSGLNLKNFQMLTRLNSEETSFEKLKFQLNNTSLQASLKTNYRSIDELIYSPEASVFDFRVNHYVVDIQDLFLLSPELTEDEIFTSLAQHHFTGQFEFHGDLNTFNVPKFQMKWGDDTRLNFQGQASHIKDLDQLHFDIKNLKADTRKTDIHAFISEEDLEIALPDSMTLEGNFKKSKSKYATKSWLKTSYGNLQLDGVLDLTDFLTYDINLNLNDLKLNDILQNQELGQLSMLLESKGSGNSLNELDVDFTSTINGLSWNSYAFSELSLNGSLDRGVGGLDFGYHDNNLQFDFESKIELDSIASKLDIALDVKGIRSQKFGLTDKDIRAKVQAFVQFEGNLEHYGLDAQLKDGLVVYDKRPYTLGDFSFSSTVDSTQTTAKLSSKFLNASLEANADIAGVSESIQNYFKNYSQGDSKNEISEKPVKLNLNFRLVDDPILSNVFLDGIERMDTIVGRLEFDEANHRLQSDLNLPFINYQGNQITGLFFNINSENESIKSRLGFESIVTDIVDVAKTEVTGTFEDRQLDVSLNAYKDEEDFFSLKVHVDVEEEDLMRIRISPDHLILNGGLWEIPADNEIRIQNEAVEAHQFELTRNTQKIRLTHALDYGQNHLGIVFDNFKLSSISSYFNPDESLVSGKLSGDLVVIDPFVSKGLVSSLRIQDLAITEVPLGNLVLKAEASSDDDYEMSLTLKDKGIDLEAAGVYHTNAYESDIDFDVDIIKWDMQILEGLADDYIKDSKGYLDANLKLHGDTNNIQYEGNLGFKSVEFNSVALNTTFKLNDEVIQFKNDEILIKDFKIRDFKDNSFIANGTIHTQSLINPEFDLNFKTKDFQLLNSTSNENEMYFGQLIFDASAGLQGSLDEPKLDLDIKLKQDTDLTYIIPESQASLVERDGVVLFVNKENPNDIVTQQDEDALNAVITGIDLKSKINIHKEAKAKVIFNKRTEDNVTVQGGGDFKFDINRNGNMSLAGKYELSKGHVELNLYNIVKRKFEIAPSSSVTWNGDVLDAILDIRGIYKVQTSPSALMASQTAGENSIVQNRYKQQLPFLVYLDVGGLLMSPSLGFQLDMPEDRQGAINGSVYGRITQINSQKEELNKQVFSLLVLNRFYPESGNDGSQGGAATLARDNINQALSDQLNAFSDKLTGNTGITLNFDVNSYTDFEGGTAQDRTELDVTAQKKLMDDRLVIEAGSQMNVQGEQRPGEAQAVVGNVSVEYLITEDGRWKLRGFRKSEYENVIDGQVFVSGIALIFTREFNKFRALWDKAYRKALEEKEFEVEELPKDDKENNQQSPDAIDLNLNE